MIFYAFQTGDSIELNEALNCRQSCISKYKTKWLKAMETEMSSLQENNTWVNVKRPTNKKVIRCKWVFKRKSSIPMVEIGKFKTRVVAKGFHKLKV